MNPYSAMSELRIHNGLLERQLRELNMHIAEQDVGFVRVSRMMLYRFTFFFQSFHVADEQYQMCIVSWFIGREREFRRSKVI
jgi:hypothetical protein